MHICKRKAVHERHNLPIITGRVFITEIFCNREESVSFKINPRSNISFLRMGNSSTRGRGDGCMNTLTSMLIVATGFSCTKLPWISLKQVLDVAAPFQQASPTNCSMGYEFCSETDGFSHQLHKFSDYSPLPHFE